AMESDQASAGICTHIWAVRIRRRCWRLALFTVLSLNHAVAAIRAVEPTDVSVGKSRARRGAGLWRLYNAVATRLFDASTAIWGLLAGFARLTTTSTNLCLARMRALTSVPNYDARISVIARAHTSAPAKLALILRVET